MTPIRTDSSNPFAHRTIRVRFPGLIDDILEGLPHLDRARRAALTALRDELVGNAPLSMFDPPAPDYDPWTSYVGEHAQRMAPAQPSWQNAEWFLAEHLFFRRIIGAVRYWETALDPFKPAKEKERTSLLLAEQLDALLENARPEDRVRGSLLFALWGNRMDLSHEDASAIASGGQGHDPSALIADQSQDALKLLHRAREAVHIVCDNAGTELAGDLCLTDWLLHHGCGSVFLHVKFHPTFVSDATTLDVRQLIEGLTAASSPGRRKLGERLEAAFVAGRLRICPDFFWNSPRFFDALPPRILGLFADADLIIIKGDLNYRRLLRDTIVPAGDPLERWASPLPAPAVILRTMKGDPLAGIDADRRRALDAEHPGWRVAGRHGVIQTLSATSQQGPGHRPAPSPCP